MVINKRLYALLKRRKAQIIGCLVLCMLSVAFLVICISSGHALKGTLNDFVSDCNVEDAEFITASKIDNIEELEKNFNVTIEEMQFYDFDYDDTTIRVLKKTNNINDYVIKSGKDIQNDNDILINDFYAENNSLSIGDEIDINGTKYNISGYFTRADYLTPVRETSESVMGTNFGIALLNDNGFSNVNEASEYYSVVYNEDNDIEFRKYLNDNYVLMSYIPKDVNNRIIQALTQADAVTQMAFMYGPILFVLTIVFVTLILWKILKNEKQEIGILSSIGYNKREIGIYYSKLSIFISVLGAVFGIILGQLCAKPICEFYANINNCPNIETGRLFDIKSLVIIFFIPVVILWITSRIVISRYLKKSVISLVRNVSTDKSKNINWLKTNKLSGSVKYSIRSALRNKGRTLVFVLGIIIASSVMLMGMVMRTSTIYSIDVELKKGLDYENTYYLNSYYNDKVEGGEGIIDLSLEYKKTGSIVNLVGIPEESEYFNYDTIDGEKPNYKDNFYISNVLAQILGIKKGDEMVFIDPITTEEKKITVGGIIKINRMKTVYGSLENVNNLMCNKDATSYNAVVSDKDLQFDEGKVLHSVKNSDFVKSLEKTFNDTVLSVVYVLMFLGIVIGFIIMYLITSMTIEENKGNISMLKILGYNNKEISKMMFRINKYFILIFYLLMIFPIVKMCEVDFIAEAESFNMIIPSKISMLDVVIGLVSILIAYYLSLFVSKKKIDRISMADSLKQNRE